MHKSYHVTNFNITFLT